MKILNLGCGTKTSQSPDVVHLDWSLYLRLRESRMLRILAMPLLSPARRKALASLPQNVRAHDLSRGIPFEAGTIDVVYHSHFLEHLEREQAPIFLAEVRRVLRPGGIQRIVVPDLEQIANRYLASLAQCRMDEARRPEHDARVSELYEQAVRKRGVGSSRQRGVRRMVDELVVGDARRRGETHQWMYDEINLGHLLEQVGFRSIKRQTFDTSLIPGWHSYGLDQGAQGDEYMPDSLYLEAER